MSQQSSLKSFISTREREQSFVDLANVASERLNPHLATLPKLQQVERR